MNNPEVSIIVPVYNVEKYLLRCIDSILAQTFENIEILLVDDGSTDSSGAMCDEYAQKDSRIRVIHKKNGGLSDARNAGIDSAAGDYLCFIDSDDFVAPNMIQVLYDLIKKNDADVSVCGICDCYETGEFAQSSDSREIVCSGIEALRLTLEGEKLPGSVCSKLIHRSLCQTHRFVKGKTYEDAFFTPELFIQAKKVAATTQSLYHYWHRAGSITTLPFSPKNMDVIEAYEHTLAQVKKNCPQLCDVAMFRLYWAHFVVLDKILVTENYKTLPQYQQVLSFLKKNWLSIVKCPCFQRSRRIAAITLKLNVRLYRKLVFMRNKEIGVHD